MFCLLILHSDNCGGQNRNKFLIFMYMKALIESPAEVITHKYLQKGHTQNEGDSMHACIEREIRSLPIFSLDQYYMLARAAKKTVPLYDVTEMTASDFLDFKTMSKFLRYVNVDAEGERFKWTDIKTLEVRKGDPGKMFFKVHYGDAFRVVDFSRKALRPRQKQPTITSIDMIPL